LWSFNLLTIVAFSTLPIALLADPLLPDLLLLVGGCLEVLDVLRLDLLLIVHCAETPLLPGFAAVAAPAFAPALPSVLLVTVTFFSVFGSPL
jgi:hypothetical protein